MTDGDTTGSEQVMGRPAGAAPQPGEAPPPGPTGGQQVDPLFTPEAAEAKKAFLLVQESLRGPAANDKDRDKKTWKIPGL